MGKVVKFPEEETTEVTFAECVKCGGTKWFIEFEDVEFEDDQAFTDGITAIECVECGSRFIVERRENEIVFEPDFDLDDKKGTE